MKHRQKLEFTDRELNRERVAYMSYKADDDSILEDMGEGYSFDPYQLEAHHTHFLLVDDGVTGRFLLIISYNLTLAEARVYDARTN